MPNIVRGEEPPKGTRERKGGRQKEEDRTPVRIPRGVQLDPMDVDSEEVSTHIQEASASVVLFVRLPEIQC